MKRSVEIIAHIFFWIAFTALVVILSQVYLKASPDSALSTHFFYLVFIELMMALILFYTTYFGIAMVRRKKRNLLILSSLLILEVAFFAYPATRHGMTEVLSSLIPHIIIIFLGVVFRRFSDSIRLEREKQELLLQNTRSELALLKMQVSPHFLFNTLNNIDYLISHDVAKASDSISKLGEMLRYMIYDANAEKIPLSKEIKHIEDYIELIRLRTSGPSYLSYSSSGTTGYLHIAPMLFIPLIENAYKHSPAKEGENIISIMIRINNSTVCFEVSNEYSKRSGDNEKTDSGIGLNLVRRRLDLIYPGRNSFKITQDNTRYNVELKLELNEY